MASESSALLTFEVGLRMRSFGELQARIARGGQVSDAEKEAKYFPLAADHDKVVAWLRDQGLEVTRTDPNRLAVFGRGSVADLARVFKVTFARVLATDGIESTSAVTAPSIPGYISPAVLGIHGLQTHIRRHPLSLPRIRATENITLNGYTPAAISAAYNATAIGTTGAGQTIAVYALGYPSAADLTHFWTTTSPAQTISNVTMINVAGGPESAPADDILEEVTLDTEWAGALAPGAALRIYGANDMDPGANDEILQQVYADLGSNPTLHILTISVGGNELDVPKDYLNIEAQYMANLASAGVSVFVASGDTGNQANNKIQTTYPTSDPDVTGVGGTTLVLDSSNNVASEAGWYDGGGGQSVVFARPSWQIGNGVPTGTTRLVPDVASSADPADGAQYYYQGTLGVIGGTSWAAPTWAGFCALINQKLGAPVGLLNPKIYPLNGTSAFRDITQGNNGFSAGAGYDLVTGIGVPNVTALAAALSTSAQAINIPADTGSQVVTLGQLATFFVVGEGAPTITYQWQRMASGTTSWVNLSDGGSYSGSLTPTLVVSGTTAAMTGDNFKCMAANGSGSATSPSASLTVNPVGVTTLAGWPGASGHADGAGRAARFAEAGGLRVDASGNIYVSDSSNYTIRKITPGGTVTTFAGTAQKSGSTDGPVATALFGAVGGVAIDSSGNVFVADSANYTIREISTAGIVSTLAGVAGTRGSTDGTGSGARLYDPQNLAIDGSNNIYVADGKGNVVRRISEAGVVTTIAGSGIAAATDGSGTGAAFNDPTGIAVDYAGNIYVADYGNNLVRKVTPAGVVTTLAGVAGRTGSTDGSGSAAEFSGPAGLGVDSSGNIYVADSGNDTIRRITQAGFVTTIAGLAGSLDEVDGLTSNARFDTPGDVSVSGSGIVYVADAGNSTIRRIIPGLDSTPFFNASPASQTEPAGTSVTFSANIGGTAPFTFQWSFNGSPIAGATTPFYTVPSLQQADVGTYTLSITNAEGTATSSGASLAIGLPPPAVPDITSEPTGGALVSGSLVLSVTVSGTGPFTYQWYLNGTAIAGATASAYTATAAGSYTVGVTDSSGTTTSTAAVVGGVTRLVNISSRAIVDTGSAITIAGFVIDGAAGAQKQVLIRGIGPTLSVFGITGTLAAPTVTLLNSSGATITSNTGWSTNANAAQIATISSQVGAFALPGGSADSVILTGITPGSYTVQLSGVGATTGVGLVEVYEVNTSDPSQLVNISTRAQVGLGTDILIAGFVVQGTSPAKVLIRGVGPSLSAFGVSGALASTALAVFDSTNTQIATNTGWQNQTNSAAVTSAEASVNAFTLSAGDSALVLTLNPGAYTAQVAGVGGTTGIALVEVYQVP
jgi:hypothetical protein